MIKKLVNIFLILVLAIQILPVQQMGAALMNNQFTEEIPHSLDTSTIDYAKKQLGKSDFIDWTSTIAHQFVVNIITLKPAVSVNIPVNHAFEILVPPPNC
jgi:hypothetical protein